MNETSTATLSLIPLNTLNSVIIHYGEKGNITGLILQNRLKYIGKFYSKNNFMPIYLNNKIRIGKHFHILYHYCTV